MSACPDRERLAAYEDGRLSEPAAAPLERHLESCTACRAAVEELRRQNPVVSAVGGVLRQSGAIPGGEASRAAFSKLAVALRESEAAPGDIAPSELPRVIRTLAEPADWPIPDYQRVVLCGEGAYGSVWVVRDRVGVYRALKTIDLERIGRISARCREREALEAYCKRVRRAAYLITIYHVGQVGQMLYYTMDLADDVRFPAAMIHDDFPRNYQPLLLSTIIEAGRLRPDIALELGRRMLRGLAALHDAELVHRDIKPTNIVFVNRQPRLADIGMVSIGCEGERPVGTPKYMTPDGAADRSADTFAMGMVLREMLDVQASAQLSASGDAPRSVRWDWERVTRVLARATSPRAEVRYAHAAAMLEEWEACQSLPVDIFEETAEQLASDMRQETAREAIELGYTLIRSLPWVFGILALIVILTLLGRTS